MKTIKAGGPLDVSEPPSEALDRQEMVALLGETVGQREQKSLPIIRSDNRTFFGLGEFNGPKLDDFEGRFAQVLPPTKPHAKAQRLARAMLTALGVTEQTPRGDWRGN